MAGPRRIADRLVQTGDRLEQDAQGLARESASQLNQCPFIRGRMVSVLFQAAQPLIVNHKLGVVARCFPASLLYGPLAQPQDPINQDNLWVQRGWHGTPLAGFTIRAGSFTVGCRFSVSAPKVVSGVRFMWADTARTVRASLWRDSTGVVLASRDIAVSDDGLYEATFRTPVDLSQIVGANLTVGIWDISGTNYVASGVDTMGALLPYVFPDGTAMQAKRLFSAGNARPTSNAATEDYWVEPAYLTRGISVAEDPDQSAIDPKNQVRLVADSTGYVDLWFYPKASVIVPTGKTQSP